MGEAKINRQKRERELKEYFATEQGKADLERQRQAYLDGTALQLARKVAEEARSITRNRMLIPLLESYSKCTVNQLLLIVDRECSYAAEQARDPSDHALLERRMTLGEVANIVIAQRDKRAAEVANGAKFSAESDTVADRSWRFGLAEAIARIKALTMTLDDKMRVVAPSLGEGWTQGEDMSWTHAEMREGRLFVDGEEWTNERAEAKAAAAVSNLAPCVKDVFENGEVALVCDTGDVGGNAACETWVQALAAHSGQSIDWHYVGGRAVIKYLGDKAAVAEAIKNIPMPGTMMVLQDRLA